MGACIQWSETASNVILAPKEYADNHFSILHSPFSILHSPFSILHSPFSILHSPFSILLPSIFLQILPVLADRA